MLPEKTKRSLSSSSTRPGEVETVILNIMCLVVIWKSKFAPSRRTHGQMSQKDSATPKRQGQIIHLQLDRVKLTVPRHKRSVAAFQSESKSNSFESGTWQVVESSDYQSTSVHVPVRCVCLLFENPDDIVSVDRNRTGQACRVFCPR